MNTTTLQADLQEWTIAGKQYKQEPFGLDRTTEVLRMLAGIFEKLALSGDFDKVASTDLDALKKDPGNAAPLFKLLLEHGPDTLSNFVCLCLDVTDPADSKAIVKHCKPVQLMGIIRTFLQQNDVSEMYEAFLELRGTFQKTVSLKPAAARNGTSTT